MQNSQIPFLNTLAATGLAVSAAILAYAGFDQLFASPTLASLTGAAVGGGVLGRMMRENRDRRLEGQRG